MVYVRYFLALLSMSSRLSSTWSIIFFRRKGREKYSVVPFSLSLSFIRVILLANCQWCLSRFPIMIWLEFVKIFSIEKEIVSMHIITSKAIEREREKKSEEHVRDGDCIIVTFIDHGKSCAIRRCLEGRFWLVCFDEICAWYLIAYVFFLHSGDFFQTDMTLFHSEYCFDKLIDLSCKKRIIYG